MSRLGDGLKSSLRSRSAEGPATGRRCGPDVTQDVRFDIESVTNRDALSKGCGAKTHSGHEGIRVGAAFGGCRSALVIEPVTHLGIDRPSESG